MWMDHRASNETDFINATKHSAFKFVGGKVSIEMQLPKLLWLKKNLADTWRHSKAFFDLPKLKLILRTLLFWNVFGWFIVVQVESENYFS